MEELIYYCLLWLVKLYNEKWALLEPSIKTLKKEKPTGRKDWIISKILWVREEDLKEKVNFAHKSDIQKYEELEELQAKHDSFNG